MGNSPSVFLFLYLKKIIFATAMDQNNTYMIPTSLKEVKTLGWDYIDVIIFTGDAFVDHPSFGTAVIARWLQKHGYRVAVVPQPNWRDDLRDFRKLGAPTHSFSAWMDST